MRLQRNLALGLFIGLYAATASATEIEVLKVIDGDTFDVLYEGKEERVRLIAMSGGVDTPETHQADCSAEKEIGKEATGFVRGAFAVAEEIVLVTEGARGGYGRLLGRVEVDGLDLGDMLLDEGLAQPWPNQGNVWCATSD